MSPVTDAAPTTPTTDSAPAALFARLMAERGLDVADVAIECGVSRTAAHDWQRGIVYPSERYALELAALFGKAGARALYAEREARKATGKRDRDEGRTLRAAARVLLRRGLGVLAGMVQAEAERAAA